MEPVQAPETGVRVRMYRPGFGDCFLLTFADRQGDPVHCLIDCGVHSGWRPQNGGLKGNARIKKIAEHIESSTAGHLHLVVLTHEHADHVSGFHSARDVFARMTVDEVWAGWTEDPASKKARALDKTRKLMLKQLRGLGLSLSGSSDAQAFDNVGQVMGFFDIPADGGDGRSFGVSTRDARDEALGLSSKQQFLKPHGDPLELPGVDGVRIFVLGPPVDEKMLKASRPTGKPDEVYEGDDAHSAAQEPAPEQRIEFEGYEQDFQPFAGNHRIPLDWIRDDPEEYAFEHEYYGFDPDQINAWRRVDGELEAAAQDLALRLDSATNNTSLVLAIELGDTGRVLLFPGDAQVGNWKSWHTAKWTEKNGARAGEVVTARDLLNRTVLYKVAHHGSHNATLKNLGLELMTSPELTAMIPVDENWARARRPYPWLMPFGPMYADLEQRTRGRIVRTDVGAPSKRAGVDWGPFHLPEEDALYVDLHIPDAREDAEK